MRKLTITLISTLILLLATLTLNTYAIDIQYETVKIGLYYDSSAKDSITVSSVGGFNAGFMQDCEFVSSEFGFVETSLTVSASGSNLIINGIEYNLANGNFSLLPLNGEININGSVYRGGVEFIPDANGKLTVINFVNINDYIAGVVGREMSPSWHIEALKAQAVCARSYAVTTSKRHLDSGFNLCNTQHCQVYQGIVGESESTRLASEETRGQVLVYDDKIVEALYSSSNGGSIGYAKNVWGNDVPYLQAAYDPYDAKSNNPRSSWTVTLTLEKIQEKLKSNNVDIGNVYDFKVTGADEFGRTYEVTIYGTDGTYVLKNDKTRSFFGLNSQKYTITASGGSETVKNPLIAASKDGEKTISVYSAKGARNNGQLKVSFYIMSATDTKLYTKQTSYENADAFVLNGSGWGHGLGMSQYGALVMAKDGFTYDEILKFYYKDVELTEKTQPVPAQPDPTQEPVEEPFEEPVASSDGQVTGSAFYIH